MLRAEISENEPDELTTRVEGFLELAVASDTPRVGVGRLSGLLARIPDPMKIVRYGATSCAALAISEATLLGLYAHGTSAVGAAFLANLAGTVPSYLLSRYWIWPGADRQRAGRQIAAYWLVSIVSMVISSFATGAVSIAAPHARALHLAVLASGYLLISLVLWVAKFLVYEAAIFRSR